MFVDFWYEIYESVKRKPTRAILTGVGITWGIFILIILVGIGSGFERGVFKLFSGFSKSTTYVYASQTTIGYEGTSVGRKITFTDDDTKMLKRSIPQIEKISPEVSQWNLVSVADERGWFEMKGVSPEYFAIKLLQTEKGRLLNSLDASENRNVALIGKNVADVLFGKQEPIGKMIQVNQVLYKVVGIIKNTLLNNMEARTVYIPYSVLLSSNSMAREFTTLLFSLKEKVETQKIHSRVRSLMARKYKFDPMDEKVFYFNSMEEQVKAFSNLFVMLRKFLWFMGVSTLVSGIIGVGNIMYSSAKERTREVGIRKSVGANTSSIKAMIMWESIALTFISGCIGLLSGWGVLRAVGWFISDDVMMMDKPGIDIPTAIAAMVILVISGTLAGLKPALYAAELNPIDALRDEN
ncbi:ABC transporter permease [Parabacteroides goldsteinii]|uniref:ABC transporter permease n=1 Tax=Parabacteroides goldsteinii TaxID=328812 RepID=UPI003AB7DD19